jgi:hypothetical protein
VQSTLRRPKPRPSENVFKIEKLNANIKLTVHKALIKSIMTYACPSWGFAADKCLLKVKACETRFSARLAKFQGAHWSAICV